MHKIYITVACIVCTCNVSKRGTISTIL